MYEEVDASQGGPERPREGDTWRRGHVTHCIGRAGGVSVRETKGLKYRDLGGLFLFHAHAITRGEGRI